MAAESKIDPMHQFTIDAIGGGALDGTPFVFTNSAFWMLIVLGTIVLFMAGGLKRELVPGRWQVAVESLVEFISGIAVTSIGDEGRKYIPWIFTVFVFILFSNYWSMVPLTVVGLHPFTVTSQFTITGVMAVISFSIVLAVGFWKHGLHFFSLFVPHGTPKPMLPLIVAIEMVSFMVKPFSLALRLFVAMIAGHILLEVFGSFVAGGVASGTPMGYAVTVVSIVFMVFVNAIELLICGIQAYVFALLTALYINDSEHLH